MQTETATNIADSTFKYGAPRLSHAKLNCNSKRLYELEIRTETKQSRFANYAEKTAKLLPSHY
jgi:hypothetical protein